MDTKDDILAKYNCIVDCMAKSINDTFIKIQQMCKDLDPQKIYYLTIIDKEDYCVFNSLIHNREDHKWYASFDFEDGCYSNSLPCKDYTESIIGMTTIDVAKFFYEPYAIIIKDVNDHYKEVFRSII